MLYKSLVNSPLLFHTFPSSNILLLSVISININAVIEATTLLNGLRWR